MRKKFFFIHFIALLLFSCQNISNYKKEDDDSLEYYPPTPLNLSKQEFRHYHRLLQNFMDTSLLKSGFNGGIIIAKNGNPIYEKYAGFVDISKKKIL
ncbi:MAG: hypothetical protein V9F46_12710 [Chitinophagaceae bacterium]